MNETGALVADLFRRSAGRLVARLALRLGPGRIDLAEDAVQHALLQALRLWPFHGVPTAPEAWLAQVAWRRALDALRAEARAARLTMPFPEGSVLPAEPEAIADDELRLLFACCHPEIPIAARVALALKTIGGFGTAEIARAFLVDVPTVQQRLVRAKRLIAERNLSLALPDGEGIAVRRAGVLAVIYLVFNEGYAASGGAALTRPELCAEAIRLGELCAAHDTIGAPEVDALLALMLLQAARLAARVDSDGVLVKLAEQDRTRWDQALIARGHRHLARAQRGKQLTSYHLQAGIAAIHALAPRWEATDWQAARSLYDMLVEIEPTPIVRLNRAIAIGECEGPAAALAELAGLASAKPLQRYAALPAAEGEWRLRLGEREAAASCFARAAALARTLPERFHLERRLAACGVAQPPAGRSSAKIVSTGA